MTSLHDSVDWQPSADWPVLRLRAELLRQTRNFFHTQHFLEVETPLLSAETVVDAQIEPLGVRVGGGGKKYWLQTSPELCMKRMLSAGGKAIYQITRAFRGEECGPLHNPEFTLIEWYRVGDAMREGMDFLSDLFQALMKTSEAKKISYRDAFLEFAEIDPFTTDAPEFAQVATANGLAVPAQLGDDVDAWRDLLLLEMVMPHLGIGTPTILYDYPASQAALAKVRDEPIPVAERFELFYEGIELANGYHELCDPLELEHRTAKANEQRTAQGRPALPQSRRLQAAMEAGLPPATGVALGFDRLVMLAAGKKELAEVMTFTLDRA
jgi:lysyl-tRNA synthetase class 2